jgi:hypothetical protein
MSKRKMFIGGLLKEVGMSAASEVGGALGKAAIARVVGGKGAGKEYLQNELLPDETANTGVEDEGPGSGITIRITKDGEIVQDAKKGAKVKKKKRSPLAGLTAAQREVYRRGLAAYMSSGNRPKTSQHAWAMARVKSAFGKREAAKIAAGKGKKKKK